MIEGFPVPQTAATARGVPITPYRRRDVGVVDVAFYTERRVLDGTLPDVLLYLSLDEDEDAFRERVERQYGWLAHLLENDTHQIERFAGRRAASVLDIVELPFPDS